MVVSFLKSVENYALQLSGHTDGHLPPAYDINKEKKYYTQPCYPYTRQQREEIQYALTRELNAPTAQAETR